MINKCDRINITDDGIDFIIKFNNKILGVKSWAEIEYSIKNTYHKYELLHDLEGILKQEFCYRMCNEYNICKLNINFKKLLKKGV